MRVIIQKKHIIVSVFLIIFCSIIFWINYSWGNSVIVSFNLSAMTFLLIFLSFAAIWEIRDFWQFRWYKTESKHVKISEVQIPLRSSNKNIVGDIIHSSKSSKDCPVIIFAHGFSDDSVLARYITIPIALSGFDVLSYDSRGTKRSRKVGNRHQFVEMVHDFKEILEFIKTHPSLSNREIKVVGFSMGSISSIYHGIRDDLIKKVVIVSAISNYRDIVPRSPVPFRGKWWLWLRYRLLGVNTNPPDEINTILSPYIQLKNIKNQFEQSDNESDKKDWDKVMSKITFIHAKNDKLIPFKHFNKFKNLNFISSQNSLLTERGGHNFLKYELVILGKIIQSLKNQ